MTSPHSNSTILDVIGKGLKVYDLSQPMRNGMPASPNGPAFRFVLNARHGDVLLSDGTSFANEVIITGGHVGTHIDALAHISHNGKIHGGIDAALVQSVGGFSVLGAESISPIFCRGILLDVAAHKGTSILPPAYGITSQDLKDTARAQEVEVAPGDVVLIRTGWSQRFENPEDYLGLAAGVPGPVPDAASWILDRQVIATGSDTLAYERIPPKAGHSTLPVHRSLLVGGGVYIVEVLDLERLAGDKVYEFGFVLSPLKIAGATGAPVRPLAVI